MQLTSTLIVALATTASAIKFQSRAWKSHDCSGKVYVDTIDHGGNIIHPSTYHCFKTGGNSINPQPVATDSGNNICVMRTWSGDNCKGTHATFYGGSSGGPSCKNIPFASISLECYFPNTQ